MHVLRNIQETQSLSGLCVTTGLNRRSYSMLGPVSSWIGEHLQADKPSPYVKINPGQISLVISL